MHECEPSELIVSNRTRRCWCGKRWSWDGSRVLPEFGT
jgi:hypothetical protein